jgi:hypothetical protein
MVVFITDYLSTWRRHSVAVDTFGHGFRIVSVPELSSKHTVLEARLICIAETEMIPPHSQRALNVLLRIPT